MAALYVRTIGSHRQASLDLDTLTLQAILTAAVSTFKAAAKRGDRQAERLRLRVEDLLAELERAERREFQRQVSLP